jgi:beta-xylosidase
MRPFVELSFMPTALASGSKTVSRYRGNVTPPKDYRQWSTLIERLVAHWVERYGIEEVAAWFFEVWNEPNLKAFWTGSQKDYFKLYRVTANAIKRVDPSLKVGGPPTARASDLVQGYSFWTCSDIFEENYFSSVPFHGGFGLLNLHGIAKPTYRAFELLHTLGTERLLVDGLHETVNAWVTRDNARVTVLLVNHALPRHSITSQQVRVHLPHAPEPSGAWMERIDENHANAKGRWLALGAPEYLDGRAVEQLHEASRLTRQACPWTWREHRLALAIDLPAHAVAALTVELVPA